MEEKKLIVVGPLAANDQDYRGVFILDLLQNERAEDVMTSDPGVTSGIFDVEYYEFYSSAALSMYLPFHEQIQKSKP